MKNKILSYLIDGILAGIMICVGAIVLMSCDNRYLGAFLFSLGLFSVVVFKYGLYTGKVGYIVNKDGAFVIEIIITLFGNLIGTFLSASLFRLSRLSPEIAEKCLQSMMIKITDSYASIFILACFCGLLMFTAVEAYRKCSETGNFLSAVFGVVMPVFVFIVCGFNHCIADMAYYFLAGCPIPTQAIIYFILAILGNAVGGMIVPLFKKLSVNKL